MSENTQNCFCRNCGTNISSIAKFCPKCGSKQFETSGDNNTGNNAAKNAPPQESIVNDAKKMVGKAFGEITSKANLLTGETGAVNLNLKDLFTDVLKKHDKDEKAEIFICGTEATTPKESDLSLSWPKPWLYSRVFLMFALTFALLIVVTDVLENINGIPGLIFIGSLAVPVSAIIFFFEVNVPRNISIFETIKVLFIGGAMSLVATLILFEFFPVDDMDYWGAVMVGLIEEIGKLIVVAYFCKSEKVKFILNGLLIGAAIGAGFAVFETSGYALRYMLVYGGDTMLSVLYSRAALAIGGHIAWAAISGAALVMVKEDKPLTKDVFVNPRFLKLFFVPIILHVVWDMPLPSYKNIPVVQIVLTVLAWIMLLVLISNGLKQITEINEKSTTEVTP